MPFSCIKSRKPSRVNGPPAFTVSEKRYFQSQQYRDEVRDECDLAEQPSAEHMVFVLHNDSSSIAETRTIVQNIIGKASWWHKSFAERVFQLLQTALRAEASMGPAMKEAFSKSMQSARHIEEIAGDFATEHPVLVGIVCAILAIGILYFLAPAVIEALGFTELGPAAGSFASRWQSLYGERVPVGSIFSYLQRLGMKWNGSL